MPHAAFPLVTIAIPIFKRLEYLPHILEIVRDQDYPAIELLISDNGLNGERVREIAHQYYPRPLKFRRNQVTVSAVPHFNQLLQEASGDYFVLLCDDDEISPNYVSQLVKRLEADPLANVAIARQELLNLDGTLTRASTDRLPAWLDGADFIVRAWRDYEFKFECFVSVMMRRSAALAVGGYPDFPRGNGSDNALLIKLCLGRHIVFDSTCVFRWRIHETSNGWSASIHELAVATRQFIDFVNHDPALRRFAQAAPKQWRQVKPVLLRLAWQTYWYRWKGLYRDRLSRGAWIKAAFALPFVSEYYRQVTRVLASTARRHALASVQRVLPRPSARA